MSGLIIILPLLSSIGAGLFGWVLGHKGSAYFTVICLGISAIISIITFWDVLMYDGAKLIYCFNWIDSGLLSVKWAFLFDSLSATMLVVVTVISTLVHLYSIGYMSEDPHLSRFMSYLSLFTFFMILLVTADNFLQLFVGWEGVGLCSYLLISFWFTRIQANKAAIKAIIINRIGDIGLTLGIILIFFLYQSVEFATVFSLTPFFVNETFVFFGYEFNYLSVICFLLFIGAIGKSAQVGLHVWLPDAMEGPTPVSALIHAATMVTAGVFLIIRCSPLFEYAPTILSLVTIVGALTAFFAATIGVVQNDLKKVIAYSTCSQLGYMVFICGLSHYTASFYHLVNHAFFKALLFLSAGVVIHALNDEQDMRKMGGLLRYLPLTYSMMLIGSLSLMGFPFLTGFYSKDLILELAFAKFTIESRFAYWLGTISAFFTAYYSIRLLYLTFLTKTNGYKQLVKSAHEGSLPMLLPLIVLSLGSIFIGYWTKDFMVGFGGSFHTDVIFTLPANNDFVNAEFLPYYIKLIPVVFSLVGGFSAFIIYFFFMRYVSKLKFAFFVQKVYKFLSYKWYFDLVYNKFIGYPLLRFGYNIVYLILDKGVIELFGPQGLSVQMYRLAFNLRAWQRGYIYNYICLFLTILLLVIIGVDLYFIQ